MNRREFLESSAAGIAVSTTPLKVEVQGGSRPVVIASANGLAAVERAMQQVREGKDTLDAVIAGVNLVEEDPNDTSVGYGGLPNERGVVQLDSSVMHGPTRGAGSVAALENIVYASRVAKAVMEYTDHVILMGQGALEFALAMGFEEANLLTPRAREAWMKWKRDLSDQDDWISPKERIPGGMDQQARSRITQMVRHHGTINCNAINSRGDLSGVTTTSGMAFKVPGRVGDSPIIGAGLYVDNEVGACGSTGRGEANLKTCASFLAVEFMRNGDSPEEAGLKTLKRIAENTTEPYLLNDKGQPDFNVNFYCVNKKGEFAGTAMWSHSRYAAHDGSTARIYDSAFLYERPPGR